MSNPVIHSRKPIDEISDIFIKTICESGVMAILAGALRLIHPLAGVILGATLCLSRYGIAAGLNKAFDLSNPQIKTAAKTAAQFLMMAASFAATWGVLALTGFPLALGSLITLGCTALVVSTLMDPALKAIGIIPANPANLIPRAL